MDTKNRIGVRKSYPARALSGLGVERAPAETPPVSGYFTTRPLAGARDYNTQSSMRHSLGVVAANNARQWADRGLLLPPTTPIAIAAPVSTTPVAVSAPVPSTQPTTQPTPWTQPSGSPSAWQRNRSSGGWGTSAVPASTPTQTGAASPPDAGTSAQAGTPIPFNWPIDSPYTDASGNIWTYQNGQWAITSAVPSVSSQGTATPTTWRTQRNPSGVALQTNGPAAQTAQSGTPVPVGWPTSSSYTDSNGNIWTYTTTSGWQVTGTSASQSALLAEEEAAATAAAATGTTTTAAGTTVSVSSTAADSWATLTSWLQGSTIITGVPNFFLVAGVGVVGLLIFTRGKR